MRFKVVGQNRDTGARMTLEFEAESKAAAERKATQAGMSVHHVADVTDGHASGGQSVNPDYRGPVRSRSNGIIKLIILAAILAAIAIYYWPRLSHMMHR
jgi:hypothetical protein